MLVDFCIFAIFACTSCVWDVLYHTLREQVKATFNHRILKARIDSRNSQSQGLGTRMAFQAQNPGEAEDNPDFSPGRNLSLACVQWSKMLSLLGHLFYGCFWLIVYIFFFSLFFYILFQESEDYVIVLLHFCEVETGPSHCSQLRALVLPFISMAPLV